MIPDGKTRVQITLDDDVLARAKEYATRMTLSSMLNKMLADALGMEPRELKARLPTLPGEEREE